MKWSLIVAMSAYIVMLLGCDNRAPESTKFANNDEQVTSSSPVKSLSVATLSKVFPASYEAFPREKGGVCGLDPIKSEGTMKFVSGWSAIAAKEGVLPEAVVLALLIGSDHMFTIANKQQREDVAKYFSSPSLIDAGFQLYIDASQMQSVNSVTIYQVFQGKVYYCEVKLTP